MNFKLKVSFNKINKKGDPQKQIFNSEGNKFLNWKPLRKIDKELIKYIKWVKSIKRKKT